MTRSDPSAQAHSSGTNGRYTHLFTPGRIGSLQLKNRIIVTAMGASLTPDGTIGDRLIDYHVAQARGGAGLIIMGVTGVAWPVGAVQPDQIAISDDRYLRGLIRLADAVHAAGGRIAVQLHHGGLLAGFTAKNDQTIWAPGLPPDVTGDFAGFILPEEASAFIRDGVPTIKVLVKEDIALVVSKFAEAALRAKTAGFDGAEIHGGHGYLLSSFLSPSTNQRTDEYGGSLQNRARILLEVVRAARASVGPDFPLWVKLDSREIGKADGITLDDACRVALMVEAAGADAITVTSYHNFAKGKLHSASFFPHEPGAHIAAARKIKAGVTVPVIASGRIEMDVGEASLAAGDFDFLAMGRKLLADPDLPRKLQEGREADIRPCIYCYTCASVGYLAQPLRCAVRPETALEDRNWKPLGTGRRVVIVGGGPGGMEAARRLSAAGDHVVLLERGARLGGTLQFAGLAYAPNEGLLNWLRRQVERSNVEVRLNTEATVESVCKLEPEVVLVATGAVREMPPIPGSELDHVLSGDDLYKLILGENSAALKRKTSLATRLATRIGGLTGMSANLQFVRKATHHWMPFGKRIVIIGGELVGLELAEFLIERGRVVTVIGEAPRFGAGLLLVRRMRVLTELREHGVHMYPGANDLRIEPDAVRFRDATGAKSVGTDHVIVAAGAHGDTSLAEALRLAGLKVMQFGDCTGIGYIEGAIRGAAQAVASL